MKLHLSLKSKALFLAVSFVCTLAFGQENEEEGMVAIPSGDSADLVEVQTIQDTLAVYKERRKDHGIYVGIDYEGLLLSNYISTLDGKTYKALFGEMPLPLVKLDVDYKYNFILGSLAAGLSYGKASLTDSYSGEDRTLEITKYGASFKYTVDMILNEPYVAPYIAVNLWQMEIFEKSPTDSFSAKTQLGFNYTLGFLFQLDWIDSDSAKKSTFEWGLENTFIDVYATQYAKTSSEDDPDTGTDTIFGAGVRLEF